MKKKALYLMVLTAVLLLVMQSCNLFSDEPCYPKQTPQLDKHYAQGVSGHIACILEDEGTKEQYLFMAGGANFPEVPAADGGKKFYYKEAYIYKLTDKPSQWQAVEPLPEKVAYAGFVKSDNALYIAGGQNETGASKRFYRLRIKDGKVLREDLPSLPNAHSGAKLLVWEKDFYQEGRFYIIGGTLNGELTNQVFSIGKNETEWREETPAKYEPAIKTLAVFQPTYADIILWKSPNDMQYCDVGGTNNWDCLLSRCENEEAVPSFGGGMAYVDPFNPYHIIFIGGVDYENRFLPAVKRGEALNKAIKEGNDSLVAQYKQEIKDFLNQPAKWHNFNKKAYVFNVGEDPEPFSFLKEDDAFARADAVAIPLEGKVLIVGGEVKPGVRSTEINLVSLGLFYNII